MSFTHNEITGGFRNTRKVAKILSETEIGYINDMSEELESVVAGTVSDGSITDAKLATAVKVGDVANLTTTSKTNVVGAINEVDANANTAQAAVDAVEAILGDTALTTTAQTVTEAVNELDAANSGMTTLTGTQTLTNKTLTSPILNTPKLGDGDAHLTLTSADQTNASATATVPDIGDAADTFVMADTAQTLTNKTLTLPKIATTGAIVDAGGDEYVKFVEAVTPVTYLQVTSGNTTVAPKLQGAGETNTDLHLLGSGTGNVYISDGTDPTKDINFELNGATTAKTMTIVSSQTDDRALTLPDATDTLVCKATTDVLTNKTLTSPVLTTPQINDTTADHQYVFAVSELEADRNVTLPLLTGNDEFTFNAHAQTLTNKTLTAPLMTDPAQTVTLSAHDYAGGHADWTLSAAELLKPYHKPTNADAAVNAIVADTIRPFCFINGTGQALTVTTAAGTGITIANAKAAFVMSDGTNVIRLTPDA